MQLLQHHGETDSSLLAWLERKRNKFVAPDIHKYSRSWDCASSVRWPATSRQTRSSRSWLTRQQLDKSNREQVVLVVRHVDEELNVHEDFIKLHKHLLYFMFKLARVVGTKKITVEISGSSSAALDKLVS
ncbi:hypothetical protein DPMN_169064 [Dreissena polymorpha]|uniref:Uncharacterized protein n=1 Tax=Dreissena polymorpha TaxID=45954 RepID=A0A9D4F6C4_DREPO|nr:hypothetical protein DPMN_169064 [Dreissena polymorpha]